MISAKYCRYRRKPRQSEEKVWNIISYYLRAQSYEKEEWRERNETEAEDSESCEMKWPKKRNIMWNEGWLRDSIREKAEEKCSTKKAAENLLKYRGLFILWELKKYEEIWKWKWRRKLKSEARMTEAIISWNSARREAIIIEEKEKYKPLKRKSQWWLWLKKRKGEEEENLKRREENNREIFEETVSEEENEENYQLKEEKKTWRIEEQKEEITLQAAEEEAEKLRRKLYYLRRRKYLKNWRTCTRSEK